MAAYRNTKIKLFFPDLTSITYEYLLGNVATIKTLSSGGAFPFVKIIMNNGDIIEYAGNPFELTVTKI